MKKSIIIFIVILTIPLSKIEAAGCTGYSNSLGLTFSSLNNLPIPLVAHISGLASTSQGGSMQSSSGYDMCISDSGNTTTRNFEIQPADGYVSAGVYPGTIRIWTDPGASTAATLWWNKTPGVNPSNATTWNGYSAVYHLGENGTAFVDSSVNIGTTTAGTAPTRVAGIVGYGQSFNGSNQYRSAPNISATNIDRTDTATWAFWYKSTATGLGSIWGNPDSTGGTYRGWEILSWGSSGAPFSTNGVIVFALRSNNSSSNEIGRATSIAVNDGLWHHIVITYDGSSSENGIHLYVDGVSRDGIKEGATLSATTVSNGGMGIGRRNTSSNLYFNGSLDELKLLKGTVWSASQITQSYNNELHPDQTAIIASGGTGPILSNVSCTANSDTSIACNATSNNASSWQVACGASSGNYTLATPFVYEYPWMRTTPEPSYGVALTGLSPSTAYHCVIRAQDLNGLTQSSDQTATTNATLATKAFVLSSRDLKRTKYSTDNSHWFHADIDFGTVAADGTNYRVINDGTGVNGLYDNVVGLFKYNSDWTTATQIGGQLGCGTISDSTNACGYSDGLRFGWNSSIIALGNWYAYLFRFNADAAALNIMTSKDFGATWYPPELNIGPATTGMAFATGNPPAGFPTSGNKTFADSDINTAGPFPNLNPIQVCNDYSVNCTWQAGSDGWVYEGVGVYTGGRSLARVRLEDLRVTNDGGDRTSNEPALRSRHQIMTGINGNLDSAWSAVWSNSTKTLLDSGIQFYVPYMTYLPAPFYRYVMGTSVNITVDGSQSATQQIYDCGITPWSTCVLAGGIAGDETVHTGFFPTWGSIGRETYSVISSTPAVACMKYHYSGSFTSGVNNAGGVNNEYGPNFSNFCISETGSSAPRPIRTSLNGSAKLHIGNGLDVLWGFGWGLKTPWDVPTESVIKNWSPNDTAQNYGISTTGGNVPVYDRFGMMNFGLKYAQGSTWDYRLTTPYNVALTDFTMLLSFQHNHWNNTVNSGEMVLDKTDLQVFRNLTSANSWKVKVGNVTSNAFSLTTDGTYGNFPALLVRRAGSTVELYSCGAQGSSLPNTLLTSIAGNNGSALGSNVLYLGATAASGSYFYGTINKLGIWNRALTDTEIKNECALWSTEAAQQGITIQS